MSNIPYDPYAEDVSIAPPSDTPSLITPFGLVIILGSVLLLAVVGWGIYQNSLSQPEEGIAPVFILPLLGQEGEFSLESQRGNVVVINFWASWCVPCHDEAPMLQRTYEAYQAQGVVFVGITVNDIEGDSLAYIARYGLTYPNVMDKGGKMEDAYRIQGVPETFVINPQGEVVKFFFAEPSEGALRQAIETALAS